MGEILRLRLLMNKNFLVHFHRVSTQRYRVLRMTGSCTTGGLSASALQLFSNAMKLNISPNEFKALPSEQQGARLKELATTALEKFGLPPESGLTLLSHRENAVFRIDHAGTGARYVMRVHRAGHQTAQSIHSELQWMDALREAGIQTPKPLIGGDGRTVQTVSVPLGMGAGLVCGRLLPAQPPGEPTRP